MLCNSTNGRVYFVHDWLMKNLGRVKALSTEQENSPTNKHILFLVICSKNDSGHISTIGPTWQLVGQRDFSSDFGRNISDSDQSFGPRNLLHLQLRLRHRGHFRRFLFARLEHTLKGEGRDRDRERERERERKKRERKREREIDLWRSQKMTVFLE